MKKRAQAAMEFLLVGSLLTLIILPSLYVFYSYSQSSNEEIKQSQLNKIGTDIVNIAEQVYYLGEPSKITIDATMPEGIVGIEIWKNQELVFFLQDGSEIAFKSKVNITTNKPCIGRCYGKFTERFYSPGLKRIIIEAKEDHVFIREAGDDQTEQTEIEEELIYCDEDNDNYYSTEGVYYCPSGRSQTEQGDDCNDNDPDINPDAAETCDNDIDDDCDGDHDCDDPDCDGDPACCECSSGDVCCSDGCYYDASGTPCGIDLECDDNGNCVSACTANGVACSLGSECCSDNCVDGYCCDTTCTGNCDRCNVGGLLGTCTDVASDCTGNCDVCSSGNCAADVALCTGNCDVCSGGGTEYNCAASAALCTGNCDQCTGSGTEYSCSALASLCTGNCDQCTGSGTEYSCSALASLCTGNCDVCSGGGTAYSCAASNALCSNTASSCYCSGGGTVFTCKSCPDTYGVCGHPTCGSYSCGNAYDNGVQCATCKACSSGSCVPVSAGTSGYGCTGTHYRCDGSGACTAPCSTAIVCLHNDVCCGAASSRCAAAGYCSCEAGWTSDDCDGARSPCDFLVVDASCHPYLY